MKNVSVTDIVNNFYKATEDLSEPLVVTKHGKPFMEITATNNSVVGRSASMQASANSVSYSSQMMGVSQSGGFTSQESQDIVNLFTDILKRREVTNETNQNIEQTKKEHEHDK